MPDFTTNLKLEKPLANENYNIEVFNNNAEKIDTAINEVNSKIGDMGRLPTYETDIVGAIDEVNRNKQNEIAQELKTESKRIVGAINEISSQLAEIEKQLDNYNSYASVKDDNGIYTVVEYKRADGTLYMKSVLSGGTSPNYTTNTWSFYNNSGTVIIATKVWTIVYDSDGKTLSKVVA